MPSNNCLRQGASFPWACWLQSLTQPRIRSGIFATRARSCLSSICYPSGPPNLSLQSTFLDNQPPVCTAVGLIPSQMEGLKPALGEYLKIPVSSFLQPGQVPSEYQPCHWPFWPFLSILCLLWTQKASRTKSKDLSQYMAIGTLAEDHQRYFYHFVLSKLWTDKPNSSLIYSTLSLKSINFRFTYCNTTLHVRVCMCMHTHTHRWLKRCNNSNRNTARFWRNSWAMQLGPRYTFEA